MRSRGWSLSGMECKSASAVLGLRLLHILRRNERRWWRRRFQLSASRQIIILGGIEVHETRDEIDQLACVEIETEVRQHTPDLGTHAESIDGGDVRLPGLISID